MQIHSDYILFVAVSLPIGFLLGYLFGRLRYRPEIDLLKDMIQKTESELKSLHDAYLKISGAHAAAQEKILALEEIRESMADTFRGISANTIQENNRSFLDLAKATLSEYVSSARSDLDTRSKTIGSMIQPVREALDRYDRQVTSMEREREKAYGGLYQQIESLAASQTVLQKETGKLATALRVPHVRGRWGEITLRRTAELSGMQNRCDFIEQAFVQGENSGQRPDMVVHLPGNRLLVIDAKVPLSAYLDSLEAETEAAQDAFLETHARQVRSHILSLSRKSYWESFESTPEFVILFIPGENFFSAALSKIPELIEEGAQKNVLLATPTTLLALLKTVAYVWNQETAAENAKAIRDLGRELYDRLGLMTGHLERLGNDLERCIHSYNQTVGSFNNRVLVSAGKFPELGIPVKNGKEKLSIQPVTAVPRKVQNV
ncbi:MAG: DNA recombination protein RmuC [Desulfobacteraceae bacterium]|nr:MAG: DNA recombination protein RmuC [Desulfobacteraceae bacterium]